MFVAVRDAVSFAELPSVKELVVRLSFEFRKASVALAEKSNFLSRASSVSQSLVGRVGLRARTSGAPGFRFRLHELGRTSRLIVAAVALLFSSSVARGQDSATGESVFVPAPRELTRPIELARQALEQGNHVEAVDRFAESLFAETGDTYFVESPTTPGLWTNLRSYQYRLLEQFPPETRELFELKFGIEARQLLDRAIAARDWEMILKISQDYMHCKAGYDAAMIMGRRYLDEGQSPAAVRQFERVLTSEIGRQEWTPEVQLLAATAFLSQGRTSDAQLALATLPDDSWKAAIDGQNLDQAWQAEQLAAWLSERLGAIPALQRLAETNWMMFRGNAQRNGVSSPGFPLLINRWRVPTMLRAADRAVANDLKRVWIEDGRSTTPAVNAIAVGDSIVMRTPSYIVGVELSTGLRTWFYPWEAPEDLVDPAVGATSVGISPQEELHERMWLDGIHGQMSSDGRRVYFIDDLPFRSASTRPNRGVGVAQPGFELSNSLVALRLYDDNGNKVEGKMDWLLGGQNGGDQLWSAGVFFLGPPLPVDGVLYALGEVRGEVRLYAIDALTAKLNWDVQVALTAVGNNEARFVRQMAGATPSIVDDLLICPTSTGAVVAIDMASRAPLWGFQYQPIVPTNVGFNYAVPLWRPGDRWADATVLLADGVIVLNPPEHQNLIALDLANGTPLWTLPRDNASWVAGAQQNNVFVVGTTEVRCHELRSGAVSWKSDLTEHGAPSGRGYLTESHLFLPTIQRRVLKIDLATGAVVDFVDTEYVLGNLICHNGVVVSHDVDWLSSFYQDESNREDVANRLLADPNDVSALLLQAQLQARDRLWIDAISTAELATTLAPDSLEAREALIEIAMLAVRNDAELPIEHLTAHESTILQSEYRTEYLIRKTQQLHDLGESAQMIETLIAIIRSTPHSPDEPERLVRQGDRELSSLAWAKSMIDSSLRHSSLLPEVDRQIREAREEALASGDLQILRRLDQAFQSVSADPMFRLELAHRLRLEDKSLEAESILSELMADGDETVRMLAMAESVELLLNTGFERQARLIAAQMLKRCEAIRVFGGSPDFKLRSGELAEEFASRVVVEQEPAFEVSTGRLIVNASEQGSNPTQISFSQPLSFDSVSGLLAPRDLRFIDMRNQIVIRDSSGSVLATINVREASWSLSSTPRAHLHNHLLIVDLQFSSLAYEVVGIDLFKVMRGDSQPIVWRQQVFGEARPTNNIGVPRTNQNSIRPELRVTPLGIAVTQWTNDGRPVGPHSDPTAKGFVYLKGAVAHCVDPMTGEVLWRRHGLAPAGAVQTDGERVWLVGVDESTVSELSLLDGSDRLGRELERPSMIVGYDSGVALAVDTSTQNYKIEGLDLATGDRVWSLEVSDQARAQLLSFDRLAILDAGGHFQIVSTRNGGRLLETQVVGAPSAAAIQVLEDAFGYLLVIKQNQVSSRQNSRQMEDVSLIGVSSSPLIDGVVYAFDANGKSMWPNPVVVDQYSVLTQELGNAPVLALSRYYRLGGGATPPGNFMDLVIVDRRSGRLLWDESKITLTNRVPIWRIDFDAATSVTEIIGPRRYVISASNEPAPPSPAARTGVSGSRVFPNGSGLGWTFNGYEWLNNNQ